MWFPTKTKVFRELSSYHAHSKGMEEQLALIANEFVQGDVLFGRIPELAGFQQELADTSKGLYLASAAVFSEQVSARDMAKKLTFFRQQLQTYQKSIFAMRQSITSIRASV